MQYSTVLHEWSRSREERAHAIAILESACSCRPADADDELLYSHDKGKKKSHRSIDPSMAASLRRLQLLVPLLTYPPYERRFVVAHAGGQQR
jgi:hypothetical protein